MERVAEVGEAVVVIEAVVVVDETLVVGALLVCGTVVVVVIAGGLLVAGAVAGVVVTALQPARLTINMILRTLNNNILKKGLFIFTPLYFLI